MAILNNSNAISTGGYDINNSLRFRGSATANLTRTPASAGNRRTFTFSAWVKRGILTDDRVLYSGTVNGSTQVGAIFFNGGDDNLRIFDYQGGALWNVATTQKFRDPSAWYHIVVAVDTTQATAANRVKMYVNGNQVTAFSVANYPSQNTDTFFNYNAAQALGKYSWSGGGADFDGYMAEVYFIDGQAKAASDFGETDTTTGVWKPKAYSGTYGTNGFYLKFSDIATTSGSNAGLGKDFSGNTNYWTTNNISVTSGTTYDAMTDSPTNTSATVANYAVLNPLSNLGTAQTLSEGNLKLTNTSSTWGSKFSTIGVSSGKWYAEFTVLSTSLNIVGIISDADTTITGTDKYLGSTANSYGYFHSNGNKYNNGTASSYGATYTTNDVIGVALDMDNGTLTFYKNGTSQGTAYSSLSGVFYIGCSVSSASSSSFAANFGQRPFSYTPPTGFVALNTFNLPDSTVVKGNTVMDATLYTGNGSTQTITNAAGFRPDFVWLKERSSTSSPNVYDAIRGATKYLLTSDNSVEGTDAASLTAFNSNGFSLGGAGYTNENAQTYVAWQWQAGSSTVTNTSGSVSAQVRANTTAGFSVVTYTSPTAIVTTVGHGLGVAPSMVIVKYRNGIGSWYTYHKSLGATKYLTLNGTGGATTASWPWNNTAPTSSVFTVGDGLNEGFTSVAYCFAEIAGFSKAFSYTGNGSADGPMVHLGFRPKFIMIKRTDSTSNWVMFDTSRSTYNLQQADLYANLSDAEATNAIIPDILSNGFKVRTSNATWNTNGGTWIGMAFAENPFKNSLAR